LVIPKNPKLTDWLLKKALDVKYGGEAKLGVLDDEFENKAHTAILRKIG
jgi:CobQ-like glutamine amidotransferase family enzyme